MSREDFIAACFVENPDLIRMSPANLAKWFYIQGELYQSNIIEGLQNKFIHFRKHLSKEQLETAQKGWDNVDKVK